MPKNVPEIDFNEITFTDIVGKGSFGVVWKGNWKGRTVAIKSACNEYEKKAFAIEIHQLSRISHENIIQLFGACTKGTNVCLVMEFADCGSLSNIIHSETEIYKYYLVNAISWLLQCAKGVGYLHAMKPKPLIHRDLKPPNLLLFNGAKVLKICDFGTAVDKSTYMTNNKGSAAWMAPEVFESCSYTEKCDVFSWGIILWEVLARQKPFNRIGNSAYSIMWAIHKGQRPPLLKKCPELLEQLMLMCWHSEPCRRPSMSHIITIMSDFYALLRLKYPQDPVLEISVYSQKESTPVPDCQKLSDFDDYTIFQIDRNKCDNRNILQFQESTAQNWQPLQIDLNSKENVFDDNLNRSFITDLSNSKCDYFFDEKFQPVEPDFTHLESVKIFYEHKQLLEQLSQVRKEREHLTKKCDELLLASCDFNHLDSELLELKKLQKENNSIICLYHNLKAKLDSIKTSR